MKGKKFDGNKYANEAIKNNAILAITNKKIKIQKYISKKSTRNYLIKLVKFIENL